ncbi:diguanylate cyclase [Psychromonas sp. KJ10-10]|uniref:GGDEF domain-containing response regulator n=1 Tax=Psychromonas sp. KJ10-10 TaxID=3391823 RepID=UPI0039B45EEE
MSNTETIPTNVNSENYELNRMVLLIDDQVIVGETISQMIAKTEDLNFHYSQFPAQTMSLIEEVQPAVILLDIMMPDIDGITLLRYIRQNNKMANIPVVMLSSKEEPSEKALAFEAGANDYLVKIPDATELIARLRYHTTYFNNMIHRDYAFHALKISQKKLIESNLELQRVATIDSLTGLYNRRYFDDKSSIEWARSLREQIHMCIILLDIDYFKQVNDVYGHAIGDEYLQKVSKALKTSLLRKTDMVSRYGGEEFILLLPHTDLSGGALIAEKMRIAILDLNLEHPTLNSVSISLGVCSVIPTADLKVENLIKCADLALYNAKDNGRNRVEKMEFSITQLKN